MEAHPICHCKNSIKLKIIQFMNKNSRVYTLTSMVEKLFLIIKSDLEKGNVEIEDSFLKTYIRSLISELVDEKLLGMKKFNNGNSDESELFFIQIKNSAVSNISEPDSEIISSSGEKIERKKCENNEDMITKIQLIDELLSLRKQVDKNKKETKSKMLHEKIHKYNEIKDIAQELLGRIAGQKNMRVKDLYTELEILDDEK